MPGASAEALLEAHPVDLAIQADESVVFKQAWVDPMTGHVFCLSEGLSKDVVQRIDQRGGTRTTRSTRSPALRDRPARSYAGHRDPRGS